MNLTNTQLNQCHQPEFKPGDKVYLYNNHSLIATVDYYSDSRCEYDVTISGYCWENSTQHHLIAVDANNMRLCK